VSRETLELLESAMAGYEIAPEEIDRLLQDQIPEDLYLDYKHGDELKEANKARRTIRAYMSAFANSAGGTLAVGVDQKTWTVTGCIAPGGGDLAEWASRCLTPIAHYFSPAPRFQVVKHPNGNVLLASVNRSLGLVPCVEKGQLVYYLRLHDQTLRAPEYLVGDIVLGRRQGPYLRIAGFELGSVSRRPEPEAGAYDLSFLPVFTLENRSFSWAEDVMLGIISLVKYPLGNSRLLGRHLLSYIEAKEVEVRRLSGRCHLGHTVSGTPRIDPFGVAVLKRFPGHTIPLRVHDHWYTPYVWKAAAYLISRGAPPIWYQLSLVVDSSLLQFIQSQAYLPVDSRFLAVSQLSSERPVVAWDDMQPRDIRGDYQP